VSEQRNTSIQQQILELQVEHRDLDEVVATLSESRQIDQLMIRRLKKRKLQLKDQIAQLKSKLIPDLDA
jgi:hypothetical protein